MSDNTTSIVLAGVGGQGILLASSIIAKAAMIAGFEVKMNEVHGMAQRGGSVIAQIRYGKNVHSPLVEEGTAKVFASLEQIEAIRFAHYLSPDGLAVVSTQTIVPVTVSMGSGKYPQDVKQRLEKIFKNLIIVDALGKANELGNIKVANVIVLGAISRGLDLPLETWHEAIKSEVKEKFADLNIRAFEAGRNS
jgi:indolepyruvate ferredoxin oxidoreductase beta subunit